MNFKSRQPKKETSIDIWREINSEIEIAMASEVSIIHLKSGEKGKQNLKESVSKVKLLFEKLLNSHDIKSENEPNTKNLP